MEISPKHQLYLGDDLLTGPNAGLFARAFCLKDTLEQTICGHCKLNLYMYYSIHSICICAGPSVPIYCDNYEAVITSSHAP